MLSFQLILQRMKSIFTFSIAFVSGLVLFSDLIGRQLSFEVTSHNHAAK